MTTTQDDKMAQEHAQSALKGLVEMGNNKLNAETDDDNETATQRIQEDALSVEVENQYRIAVTLGGPNIWLVGDLNEYNEPKNARLELFWGTSTETVHPKNVNEEDALLEYARQFYFEV